MSRIYEDQSYAIGNTPLVKLNKLTAGMQATVLAKVEARNPAFSVKCRVGANMIWDAEKRGVINKDSEIVEPTSGNTGIALAYVCAARGYKLTLTMPESMSLERRSVLAMLGANIVLTPANLGMKGAIDKATELVSESPETRFMPQQFNNPANPEIHEKTTGPEIWNDTDGEVDVIVAGVGTGGTITGVSRFIKNTKGKSITSVAVEPIKSPVITQTLNKEDLTPSGHMIQGIGAGFIPGNLDLSVIDRVEQIEDDDAIATARELASEEGILCGISSGAAVAAALRLASEPEYAGKTIVVILPDLGERYLSTKLYEGITNK